MIWINLIAVILVLGYAQWLFYRGRRFIHELSHTAAAGEVLKNVQEQHRFYFIHGIGSLIGVALLLGVKSLLLFFKLPEPTAFTAFAFGDFASRFLIVKLGCLGVVLMVIFLGCLYQYMKSKHYLDVIYALRDPLGLGEAG
jgi:uncharacterized membrane protein